MGWMKSGRGRNSGFPKLGRGGNRPGAGKIWGFRSWAAGETAQVRGKFGVSEAGPRAKPPKCGENSGFPKLGRGRNRPGAGKIRGFRGWAAGGTAQVQGKFGVSEAGPREEFGVSESGPRGKPPKCGENSGFPKLDRGRNRPSAGKIRGFRSWAAGETAQVRGKFGVSEAGPREEPPKCGENSRFP